MRKWPWRLGGCLLVGLWLVTGCELPGSNDDDDGRGSIEDFFAALAQSSMQSMQDAQNYATSKVGHAYDDYAKYKFSWKLNTKTGEWTMLITWNDQVPGTTEGTYKYIGQTKGKGGPNGATMTQFVTLQAWNGVWRGHRINNSIFMGGTISATRNGATANLNWTSQNFRVDGHEYRIFLQLKGSIGANGSGVFTLSGSIDGNPIYRQIRV
jgi:hypothetical protein